MIGRTYLFCFFLVLLAACSASRTAIGSRDTLRASQLHPYGRFLIDSNHNLQMISSAMHFGYRFKGSKSTIQFASPTESHAYIQYELDGKYQQRVRIDSDSSNVFTIAPATKGKHEVWIYKGTEALTGPVTIHEITGRKIRALPNPDLPLIEFIGNSITSGAAADASEIPCGKGEYPDHHNSYYAYGPRTARALHANYILSSVSGIGIYRTWNMDGPSMPEVYEKTELNKDGTQNWNFAQYDPKIVCIALGTNDLSRGDGVHQRQPFDSAVFITHYVAFIQLVRSKYPRAQIVLLSSPMVQGENNILLQNCLRTIKERIDILYPSQKKIALHFFEPMTAHGCAGHPDVNDHAIIADSLIPFLRQFISQQ